MASLRSLLSMKYMKVTSTTDVSQAHGSMAALPKTRWSVVAKAVDRDGEMWVEALDSITLLYRPVLVRYLNTRFHLSPDRAEDLVQAFLTEKILEQNILRHAVSERGRFRSFMLKVFSNFVLSQLRAQQAQKRSPSNPDSPRLYDLPDMPASDTSLSESFDILWARQVLSRTIDLIRDECRSKDRQALWGILEARILEPVFGDSGPMPYEQLVARFGLRSPSEASNLLITAKRMFARVLHEVVRDTVADDSDVESEIMELRRILAK